MFKKIITLICLFGGALFFACEQSANDIGLTSGGEVLLRGSLPGELFGAASDFIGDLNGDGLDDIVVGAPGNSQGGANAGAAFVFLSPITEASKPIRILGQVGEKLGSSVLGAGDLDGDGSNDIVIGAPGVAPGRVYIFQGDDLVNLTADDLPLSSIIDADLVLTGLASGLTGVSLSQFGAVLSRAGDFNRDGRLDLAVADPSATVAGEEETGVVFIFSGGLSLSLIQNTSTVTINAAAAELKLTGVSGTAFGSSMNHAGDSNGDFPIGAALANRFGDDLLVGAPMEAGGGAAYLFLGLDGIGGSFTTESFATVSRLTRPGSGAFGRSVAGAGDLNGDGFDETVVGHNDGLTIYQGFAEIGILDNFAFDVLSGVSGDDFAATLAGGRGFTFPPQASVLVGAPQDSLLGSEAGTSYLFRANVLTDFFTFQTSLLATATAAIQLKGLSFAPVSLRNLSTSVRYGGDLNGDGAADALLGMPNFDGAATDSGGLLLEF